MGNNVNEENDVQDEENDVQDGEILEEPFQQGEERITEVSAADNVDKVRDIIFGSQMREYNNRFRRLARDMDKVSRELERKYSDLEIKMEEKAESLSNELQRGIAELDKKITEALDNLSLKEGADFKKLSDMIDELTRDTMESMERLTNEQNSRFNELREQLRRNYDELRNELVSEVDSLEDSKVDRFNLAESLIALGMKLKGEGLLDEFSAEFLGDEQEDEVAEQ